MYIYHLDSAKVDTFSLRKVKAAKFSENSKFKFLVLTKKYKKFRPYQCVIFKKEMFLLCPYEEMYSYYKLLIETFSYLIVSHSNINFLEVNKLRHQKFIQKCWSNRLVLPFLDMFCLLHKQAKLYSQININKYLYCNELHLFSVLFLFWFQWHTEQVFMFGKYLVPISIYKFKRQIKLRLNSH